MAAVAHRAGHVAGLGGVARGSALNLLGAVAATIANLGLVVVVTRGSTPTVAGAFFTVTSAFLLASTVARLGTNTGLVFFISRARATGSTSSPSHLVRLASLPVIALALVATISVLIWAPQLARLMLGDNGPLAVGMLRVTALALPAGVMHEVYLSATRGYRQMAPTVFIERMGIPVGQLLCLLVVVWHDGSATHLAIAWAMPYVPALVAGWWAWRRLLNSEESPSTVPGETSAATFWRFTAPRAVSSVAQLAMARADILLVAAIRGPVEAALYTAATRFVVVGQLGMQALSLTVQPRLAALASTADYAEAGKLYRVATTWLVLLVWPVYLATSVLAGEVVSIFGGSYRDPQTVAVIIIMSVAMLAATATGMVDVFLNMAGKSSWTLVNAVSALTIMIGLDVFLIEPYGAVGASIGWATAIVIRNAMALTMLWHAFGIHPFGRSSGLAAATGLLAFGFLPGVGALVTGGEFSGRIAGLGVGLIVFVFAVLRWRDELQTSIFLQQLKERRSGSSASSTPTENEMV
ncbi:MAG: oligosaccharide flippase family protein [Nocardioidaceae bacterium]